MKKTLANLFSLFSIIIIVLLILTGCDNGFTQYPLDNFNNLLSPATEDISITDDGSTTDYTDTSTASARAVISADLYENFTTDGTVYVSFDGTSVTANIAGQSEVTATSEETSLGKVSDKKVTIITSTNTEAGTDNDGNEIDEASNGIILQYKGTGKIKYVLSGTYTGTVFIKNKNADAALVLNNVNITSDNGAGPVLRFSSQQRTFIVSPAGTENTLTDTRVLNQSNTMYDDKKGSVYSKGALIFTGETSSSAGGNISIINKGYKHAVYSKDYVRIANLSLNVSVNGVKGRDCIRALNAVIIDNGNISLIGKGTLEDDESVGIKVEGEDADEDDLTVEYTAGAGFVIINGGKLTINTVAKGITAHWKSSESVISNANYTATANESLLYSTFLNGTSATTPNPYVEINGGIINITTTGEPYEGATDDDPSCSPEGIESKGNLTINAGTITLNCTDDAINAAGNITINGGAIYAYSSKNDAIDSNGSSGITINGGVIVALGLKTPECAFDCDQNPFKIRGGILVGLGTSNFSSPTNCTQGSFVLASSHYGSANTNFAIVDSNDEPVFVYTLPAYTGQVMILSSPLITTNTSYTIKTGVTVDGGSRFHNLYTSLPSISGGSTSLSDISLSSSSAIYTDSSITGFGGRP
ncbi:MAG: carbohydrate-binding domain-containing protein [Treponema sp.]|nr:carbohydrate-binding domain-containing protein [Treponema sp.]